MRTPKDDRYYVDHVVDLAGTAALVAGMSASGVMTPAIAIALLAAYGLVSGAGGMMRESNSVSPVVIRGLRGRLELEQL